MYENQQLYLAHPEFLRELKQELVGVVEQLGDLLIAKAGQTSVFALDVWRNPVVVDINSIGDAVKKLKSIQPFWYPHIISHARRILLITEQLPSYQKKLSVPHQPTFPEIRLTTYEYPVQ